MPDPIGSLRKRTDDYRVTRWFRRRILIKLRANAHKGGCRQDWLFRRLGQEVGELRRALARGEAPEAIISEGGRRREFRDDDRRQR
jgi:hypothetical protein